MSGIRKSHCVRGHEFDEENTYISPDGRWRCRACHRYRQQVGVGPTRVPVTPLRLWVAATWGEMPSRSFPLDAINQRRWWDITKGPARRGIAIETAERAILTLGGTPTDVELLYPPELYPIPNREIRCAGCGRRAHRNRRVNGSTFRVPQDLPGWGVVDSEPLCAACCPKHARAWRPEPRKARVVMLPSRCRSGDDCARRAGHGPNGRFCEYHGAELDRIFAELHSAHLKRSEIATERSRRWRAAMA